MLKEGFRVYLPEEEILTEDIDDILGLEEEKMQLMGLIKTIQKDNVLLKNSNLRVFTPIERERLQGFPDNWTQGIPDKARIETTGNAVTVPVIELIGRKIRSSLKI